MENKETAKPYLKLESLFTIKNKSSSLQLSIDEAKALYHELEKIFGNKLTLPLERGIAEIVPYYKTDEP